jgi:hypothetical protein
MGPVAQWMAGEENRIDLWGLFSPFLFLCLPAMAVVAASAVLFETVPRLRGGLGNVAWFCVWMGLLPAAAAVPGFPDPFGLGVVSRELFAEMRERFGKVDHSFVLGGINNERVARTFVWNGMHWTSRIVLGQLTWLVLAVGFDPSRGRVRTRKEKEGASEGASEAAAEAVSALPSVPVPAHLHPLPEGARRFRFLALVRAETRLLLQGQRWWWYGVALGLMIASLASPLNAVRQGILPVAWIWPLLVWSALGNREARYGTAGLVFSAARPLSRQLPAAWAAGVLLALATWGAAGLRLALAGDWPAAGAWAVAALFIPTLALTLGVWSGGGKLFEVVYLILWYLGPMQHVPGLDFLGTLPATAKAGTAVVVLIATALLGLAAVAGRKRQLQMG